jgi:hypothetical protein
MRGSRTVRAQFVAEEVELMSEVASQYEADAINDAMVQAMARRREERPNRRHTRTSPRVERRQICAYCFQHGDHPTPAFCLRALER